MTAVFLAPAAASARLLTLPLSCNSCFCFSHDLRCARASRTDCSSRSKMNPSAPCFVPVQEYDELLEMQVKLEEKLQELEANPPR